MTNQIQNVLDLNKVQNIRPHNQGQLASLSGVRREYMNRIINGKVTPTVRLAIHIARALKKPVENVFIVV